MNICKGSVSKFQTSYSLSYWAAVWTNHFPQFFFFFFFFFLLLWSLFNCWRKIPAACKCSNSQPVFHHLVLQVYGSVDLFEWFQNIFFSSFFYFCRVQLPYKISKIFFCTAAITCWVICTFVDGIGPMFSLIFCLWGHCLLICCTNLFPFSTHPFLH